jgi:predicted Zn-dependent protease with MMP-like domain
MDNIRLRNPEYKEKYDFIVNTYYNQLPEEQKNFAKMVIINFKKNSSNEELIIMVLLY